MALEWCFLVLVRFIHNFFYHFSPHYNLFFHFLLYVEVFIFVISFLLLLITIFVSFVSECWSSFFVTSFESVPTRRFIFYFCVVTLSIEYLGVLVYPLLYFVQPYLYWHLYSRLLLFPFEIGSISCVYTHQFLSFFFNSSHCFTPFLIIFFDRKPYVLTNDF